MSNPPDGLPKYRLLSGSDPEQLSIDIAAALEQGFRLWSGIVVANGPDGAIFAQAVIWPEERPDRGAPRRNFNDRDDRPRRNFGDRDDRPRRNFGDRDGGGDRGGFRGNDRGGFRGNDRGGFRGNDRGDRGGPSRGRSWE